MSESTTTPLLTGQYLAALTLAHTLHVNQVRKGTKIPYISHLLFVSALVLEDGGSELEAIAALLHDAVEDQGGLETLDLIRVQFGEEVADIVAALSDSFKSPKPPWRERKEMSLERLSKVSESALRVAIAVRLHNAKSQLEDYQAIGESFWDRFNASKADCLWFLDSFIDLCQERQIQSPNLIQLQAVFKSLSTLSQYQETLQTT